MGCDNCGSGKPNGCKSNGGCSTGGCNRMNAFDWLMNMPLAAVSDECKVIEVSFNQGSRKDYFRNTTLQQLAYSSTSQMRSCDCIRRYYIRRCSYIRLVYPFRNFRNPCVRQLIMNN